MSPGTSKRDRASGTNSFSGSLVRYRISRGAGLSVVEVSPTRLIGRRRGSSTPLFDFARSENIGVHFDHVSMNLVHRTEVTFIDATGNLAVKLIFVPLRSKAFRKCLVANEWTTLPRTAD